MELRPETQRPQAIKPPERRVALYFDPATHHFLNDRLFDPAFAGHAGDQILAPYAYMKEYLNAGGVEVHTADLLPDKPDGTLNLYVTAGMTRYKRLAGRRDVVLSAFFPLECPTVEPFMFRELKDAQLLFKRVYSWSDSASLEPFVGAPLRCLPLRWPQSFEKVHQQIWERTDRGFLVMLNGNKLPRYASPCRELYSERMRALEYFSATGDIDLYGHGWDGPTYRIGRVFLPGTFGRLTLPGTAQKMNRAIETYWQRIFPERRLLAARKVYRGFARSKAETLGKYKFALCFENSILKGWITEKIFDCFFAGTVPVYWGAPDIAECIPEGCFIDMRRFGDYRELKEFLKSLTEPEIVQYKECARDFLRSSAFEPFTKKAFAELFGRMVDEDAGVRIAGMQGVHA